MLPLAGMLLAFLWAFAEATAFVVPADVVVVAAAALYPERWLLFALGAAAGALAGGAVTRALTIQDPAAARRLVARVHPPRFVDAVVAGFRARGYRALLIGGFAGRPYKIYALAAGEERRDLLPFLAASLLARLSRFALAAFVVSRFSVHTGRPRLVAALAAGGALALTWLAIQSYRREPHAERL